MLLIALSTGSLHSYGVKRVFEVVREMGSARKQCIAIWSSH